MHERLDETNKHIQDMEGQLQGRIDRNWEDISDLHLKVDDISDVVNSIDGYIVRFLPR